MKQDDEALKKSEEHYKAIADFAYDWVFWQNAEMQFEYVSPSCERISGYSADEFIADPDLFIRIVNPEEREMVAAHMADAGTGREPVSLQFRINPRNGEEKWIFHVCQPVFRADGAYLGRRATNRDITEQKSLERRVEYLARFPAENPNPVIRVQSDGILRYANDAAQPLLEAWQVATGGKIPEIWHDRVNDVLNSGKPVTCELEVGNDTYSFTIAPLREHGYANLYATLITERKELHEQEKRAGMLTAASRTALDTIEAMEEGVALMDMDGSIRMVNPALMRMTGYRKEHLEGRNISDLLSELIDPGDIETVCSTLETALHGYVPEPRKMTLVSSDSRRISIIPRIVFIQDDSGCPTTIVLTIQDISEIEEANKKVHTNAQRLAEAQSIAHLGNWEWDIIENELTWSDEIYRIFGRAPQEFGTTHDAFLESVHPDDREFVREAINRALKDGEPYSIDHRIILPDGRERYTHDQAEIFRDKTGKAIRMVGTVQDITERKQLEQALNVQDKLASLGRVAAGIAHEIRNPLSGMQIFMDSIRRKCRNEKEELDPEWVADILGKMKAASRKIEGVIQRVMDFVRPTTPKFSHIDVNKSVNEAVNLSRLALQKSGIEFEMDLAKALPQCRADSSLISQVILNLISNAGEAMKTIEKPKKIGIITRQEEKNIHIIIRDNGPGVGSNDKEKIFEPFFTTKQEGTGIGLSLCQRIISDHAGSLLIYDSEWGGAEFIIILPLEKETEEKR
jgi:PAS domain S-box-containing protein